MKKRKTIIAFIAAILVFFSLSLQAQEKGKNKEKAAPIEKTTEKAPTPELSLVNNILYVKKASAGSTLEIVTIVGNRIKEIKLSVGDSEHELDNLPKGIYIFKLEGLVRKFIIK